MLRFYSVCLWKWIMKMEHWWWRETCSIATFSTTNPTWLGLEMNLGLHSHSEMTIYFADNWIQIVKELRCLLPVKMSNWDLLNWFLCVQVPPPPPLIKRNAHKKWQLCHFVDPDCVLNPWCLRTSETPSLAGAVEYYTDIKTLYYGKIPSRIWYDLCSVRSLEA